LLYFVTRKLSVSLCLFVRHFRCKLMTFKSLFNDDGAKERSDINLKLNLESYSFQFSVRLLHLLKNQVSYS
jgi:hypothetical protein